MVAPDEIPRGVEDIVDAAIPRCQSELVEGAYHHDKVDNGNGANGNVADGNIVGNGDSNLVVNGNGMQQGTSTKWQAMFWSDGPISNPQDQYEEDESIEVNEEHLYEDVDHEAEKEVR
ncbi:hypothetical protein E2562_037693 [Oryza meyeriana var. granulata]|uniref:Uncharacterized protein n=1 Tax=Oryza meyeriana var. granulata TaxID=110450 RepID=A0A6G1ECR5_9ORYZ|nr:hypothetical protein E2562_037693 [Oryza meyeriana var. granulata]